MYATSGLISFDMAGHFDAVHLRHVDVGDDQVRSMLLEELQPFFAILGGVNSALREFRADYAGNDRASRVIVFHQQQRKRGKWLSGIHIIPPNEKAVGLRYAAIPAGRIGDLLPFRIFTTWAAYHVPGCRAGLRLQFPI
jgi:hypothetical protein